MLVTKRISVSAVVEPTEKSTGNAENAQLLELADRLQKQNEVLILPPEPRTKPTGWQRLTGK